MSADGDKASVFKTTKVRTRLRGDNSWLQRRSESQPEAEAEKPWIAEVRAGRLNGANVESSPESTPTKPQPQPQTQTSPSPAKTSTDSSPTSGFMIRGVFTKTNKTPTTSNGYSGTTQFTKKPSETYKKIAPHIVRNTENPEDQLSQEEQEKRTQAASNVLRNSAARQRSYVLSAAKIYESKDKTPDLLVNSTTSFVAQRVEVADDEDSNASTSPTTTTTTTTTVTNVTPLPKPRTLSRSGSTQIETKAETKPNEIVAEEKTPEKDPFENLVPGCTKVATPLPELIPDLVQAVYVKSDDSADTEQPESPAREATPPPQAVTVESVVTVTEETVRASPEPETDKVEDVVLRLKEEEPVPLVELVPQKSPEIEVQVEPEPQTEPEPKPEPEPEQDLVQVQFTQIIVKEEEPEQSVEEVEEVEEQKETEPEIPTQTQDLFEIKHVEISVKEEEPVPSVEEKTEYSVELEPSPPLRNVEPKTDDLLGFNDSGSELVHVVPPSTGPWSQDLLSPVESEKPGPEKPGNIVELLSNEDIVITQVHSLSTHPDVEEENPPATEAQSVTETVTITTRTLIITDESEAERADPPSSHTITTMTESSSTDPFDPYPIGTTSSNSSSDLLQPLADISINSASSTSVEPKETEPQTHSSSHVLDSLSDDIIPFNTGATTTSLSSHRSWARTWETPAPESTEESQEAAAAEGGQDGEQQTVIMFERKSKENDSPWDRWTSPTVYTLDNEEDEEEEPAKSEETETQVISTVTTIRETYSEPETSMDRFLTEPEPESKKPFVYVKEYVNTSEMALHNVRDTDRSDYLTSTSSSYSYSSPSTSMSGSLSSKCNFCGKPVGSDAKITIEHLNINCHPECFKCPDCGVAMGDLSQKMFLHAGKVYCGPCYRKV